MNATLKTIFRLTGIGMIIFGLVGSLPSGWAMAAVGLGLVGVIAGGGGG
ncbi:MAG: hypothetical protein M1609_01685 [Firmicutes bacterium]|nr:hypothetical protein [Bacillota bacterium]